MIKVAVIGAGGRMGSEACRAIDAADDMELVARAGRGDDLRTVAAAGAEVAVELSVPASVAANARFCVENGIHVVVGATGLTDADQQDLDALARTHGVSVFVAPNFALGAVLMMRFAQVAARHLDAVEIIERHHDKKLDAPSGTAARTAASIRAARGDAPARPEPGTETVPGVRGGDAGGVRIHSLRLPGSVAHQEVIFGGVGETLTLRHDSLDRSSFMPGLLLAVRKVTERPGVTVGLEHLLEL